MALPAFHTFGIIVQIIYALYSVTSIALYPPTVLSKDSLPMMPTPANILEHTARTKANGMFAIPALLQVWAQQKEAVELLKTMAFVVSNLVTNYFPYLLKYLSGLFRRTRITKARRLLGRIRCQT